jgi:molybdopterin-containing oxidoreductase family iron-sulfur binding subunit
MGLADPDRLLMSAAVPIHWSPERPGAVTRREALAWMAASLALGGGGCSAPPNEAIHPYVNGPEAGLGGQALYYASAFVRDGFAHGVLVGTREGRPVKVEGNPSHPSSLGATDVFAQASVLQLWDPDRSQTVLQRLGTAAPAAPSSWSSFERECQARAERWRANSGAGLHLLTGPITSPTERALLARLLQRYPAARRYLHAPLRDEAAVAGARAAFGRELAPVLHLDRARCVLALNADPFSEGPGAVRQAMDWAARRAGTTPPLAIALEATPGLFGARADWRVALPPARIEAMLAGIAASLSGESGESGGREAGIEQRIAAALRTAGSEALLVAGRGLSPQAHALVHALNQRLGAFGRSIEWIEPPAAAPEAGSIAELVQALHAGEVDTLLMFDVNPAYDAPGALGFQAAMQRAAWTVHAGLQADETARASHWHLPLSHTYEQWSDALAHDGSASIVQPAIAPLYDTRSVVELLALFGDDDERSGYALVRRQWQQGQQGHVDAGAFEAFWRDALRRGVVEGSATAAVTPKAIVWPHLEAPAASAMVALFAPDPHLHDGRFANNAWLQELPRPGTSISWDNAVLLGPQTARTLQLASGDVVRARIGERSVEAPVWVDARHAEGAVTLPLGLGRRAAGRVGSGVGFDAYAIRPLVASPPPVSLQRTGRRHEFARTQTTLDDQGRDPVRIIPAGARIDDAGTDHPSLYPPWPRGEHAWAMAIDLDACIGCNACTIACQAENNIPVVGREQVARGRVMHWIRVDRYEHERSGQLLFQPVPCMHCEHAPCELVCPVGATLHDSEGLNLQVYNRCIGTRFCSNNCPYKVRRFNFLAFTDERSETLKAMRNPDVTVRSRGVMEKCSYCVQRIARARQHADRTGTPLHDGDVVTACQAVCPTRAIHFGDLNDPASDVALQKRSSRHYALLGELNTRPRTTYLARIAPRKV